MRYAKRTKTSNLYELMRNAVLEVQLLPTGITCDSLAQRVQHLVGEELYS